jgi:membrane protein implicated in regulation of membrane protease activity
MELILDSWFWLIVGAIFILAELIIPGGIVVFLGIAALVVASALMFGLVETWTAVLTLWFISSLVLVILLRSVTQKFAGGDSTVANTDEILDVFGERVKVVDTIGPGEKKGRVIFRGAEWHALGDGGVIETGQQAQVVSQDNITLIVQPLNDDDNDKDKDKDKDKD